MQPVTTPTLHSLPQRPADFPTLTAALDYAALGETGMNFFDGHGALYASWPYKDLREQSVKLAGKLLGLGFSKGERVALIAETHPDFVLYVFACQYAGLIPVALPASIKVGAHRAYVEQLRRLLEASDAALALSTEGYLTFLQEASEGLNVRQVSTMQAVVNSPTVVKPLPTIEPDDIAYIQYTSGSTRFPRGVVIRHRTAMANISGMVTDGLQINAQDRLVSWLPFYHDMGLVGFVLLPVSAQLSVDFLDTRDFAMRPRLWLKLMTDSQATIAFAPSFGYDLCARRLRDADIAKYDLSNWRVAGIGAEMIRPQTLELFEEKLAASGFDSRAFLACYGMAECTLGISFSPLSQGYTTHYIDSDHLADAHEVVLMDEQRQGGRGRHFVNCGRPLPSFEVEIRDDQGRKLEDWKSGVIHVRGPSVMSGYFNTPEDPGCTLAQDGWLNTGDIGYMADGALTITGRKKDVIIMHGRNIWPQDLEHIAETLPEVRVGDALAFSAPDPDGDEFCVLQVQCREKDTNKRNTLKRRLSAMIRMELNLDCYVELVPNRSLPKTSSGKLSRAKARQNFTEVHHSKRLDRSGGEVCLRAAIA